MPKRILHNPDELSTFDLAQYLGVNRRTLLSWVHRGLIDEPARRGNKRIWTRQQAEQLKMMVGV